MCLTMLKGIKQTSKFKKDLKAYKNDKKLEKELETLINLILTESEIPDKYDKHPLKGQYKGEWDYHIRPNLILICHVDDGVLSLSRIGTHNKLGLTEDISSYL